MSTPESNQTPQPDSGQHPDLGSHTFPQAPQSTPPQPPVPPAAHAPGTYPPQPGQFAPQPGQHPAQPAQYPPYAAPGQPAPYSAAQPGQYPAQPGQYPQYAAPGQPGAYPPGQYGYPVVQPARIPTGTLSWALGFLIFLVIPFVSGIISGAAMALSFGASAKHGGIARENARSAANWGLTYVTVSVVLLIVHFILVAGLSGGAGARGFYPIGIAITLYFALSILHVVLVIVGTVKASSGKVMRVPFAIPYIRA